MTLTIIYRPKSDHARAVTEFVEMLRRRYPGKEAELLSTESVAGAEMAKMHNITQYPAMIVKTYEGRVAAQWEGEPLPLVDEVGSMIRGEQSAPTL